MNSEQVIEQLKRIVVEDLDVNLRYEDLNETVPLFEDGLGFDSVVVVELVNFIERRFKIELQEEALNMETFKNLQSVARVVCELLAEQQSARHAQA
jgi:acyl carrier protein